MVQYAVFLLFFFCTTLALADFTDKSADPDLLPAVPAEFHVSVFAREPIVRQPCAMAFDAQGRLFVGMGPQYRKPKPDTPGDSVVIVQDTNGDGQADATKVFATGFNSIQGLAWHGRDLWIANAPDLTVVRDLDGDDEADEYVKLYTDLGNLEHGLHGLNWAPDGKLYMSKGNSKGLNQPGRYAPKPFRDLWGLTAPEGVPDFPAPTTSTKEAYRRAYHNPSDDWGMDGGVLRCGSSGQDLEIVSRGFRNPWDITMDSGFNWLGTDNDQSEGDRVFMPFYGAHFGWNHPWSSHWSPLPHAPTAPVSGPLFQGSGTGVIFCRSPQFPPEYRGVFLVNDWLSKTTYVWRPEWDGAMMRPAGGKFTPFIQGGDSLFRPTDLEFGPDGALWVLGWSRGYGAEWQDGQLTNEGRILRITWKNASKNSTTTNKTLTGTIAANATKPLEELTVQELVADFDSPLPVRRINAQDELVRRGADAIPWLFQQLREVDLTENQETWTIWSLGRIPATESQSPPLSDFLHGILQRDEQDVLNRQVQAVRIFSYRAKQFQQAAGLADSLSLALAHPQPRVRFAAVQAIHEANRTEMVPEVLDRLANESDGTIFYAGWQTLRGLTSVPERRELLTDTRPAVRRAALLSLLESHALPRADVVAFANHETDATTRQVAQLWLTKTEQATGPRIKGRSLAEASGINTTVPLVKSVASIKNVRVQNGKAYKVVPSGFAKGQLAYIDRRYRLSAVPSEWSGCDLIQTANSDESSQGDRWLRFDAIVPVRVRVGLDERQQNPPDWLTRSFDREPHRAALNEGAKLTFYGRTFDAGTIEIGGNTDDGVGGSLVNYVVAVSPLPLEQKESSTTAQAAMALLDQGNPDRGEVLFGNLHGAGCFQCHSLDESKNSFGPNLSNIGLRSNARHIVQSIVEPSAIITEGFRQLTVITDEGKSYSGVLLEESGLTVSLGQSDGQQVDIPKSSIEERTTSSISAMPQLDKTLSPQQVADLAAFLLSMRKPISGVSSVSTDDTSSVEPTTESPEEMGFQMKMEDKRLRISLHGKSIVDFVFQDEKTLRPYFANAKLVNGQQVTRNHPPIEGVDAMDHADLHPGIWLAFGDINGLDFWRNKAAMEHVRFVSPPKIAGEELRFATECVLKKDTEATLCRMTNHFTLAARPHGWLLVWEARFDADQETIIFGDQEEMGFGARVATGNTEKNGGVIRSSTGLRTAKKTWGQTAKWCDYSGADPQAGGIMLMASPANFRESWWHNRNYGAFVSNPFGRKAMKQGDASAVSIEPGKSLTITFGAMIHDQQFDAATEYAWFREFVARKP